MKSSKWYESSSGSGLSLTLAGLSLGGIVPVIAFVLAMLHVRISESDIAQILSLGATAVSSLMVIIGILRKVYFAYKNAPAIGEE